MSEQPRPSLGAGTSQLSEEQVEKLRTTTPFTDKEIVRILRRYSVYDDTEKGVNGIPYSTVLQFPEFIGHPLVPKILELFVEAKNKKIYAEKFLYFLAALSSRTSADVKRRFLFQGLDIHGNGYLQYEELYKLYKALFDKSLSDDQILNLTFRALHALDLSETGKLSKEDFKKLIPDGEITSRMTVDLQNIT